MTLIALVNLCLTFYHTYRRMNSASNQSNQGFPSSVRAHRRHVLRVGSLALGGLTLADLFRAQGVRGDQKWYDSVDGPAKSVIQIILPGAVSAQESWNPKPESPLEYRGPFGVNQTSVSGIVLGEMMPQTAKVVDKLTILRSVVGKIPDHGAGQYHMFRGYPMTPALKHPTIGSVVNHEYQSRGELPGYLVIGDSKDETGYLSPKYGPFTTGADPASSGFQVRDLRLPGGVTMDAFESRKRMRDAINAQFRALESNASPLDTMDAYYQRAYRMMTSQAVRDAFDLSKEPEQIKQRYGKDQFYRGSGSQAALRMLLARRLVEAGARFVTLRYGQWDDHSALQTSFEQQMPAFDHAFAALINDLDERGLLDSTLVWVASEFGRTPKINQVAGRDHWSRVFSIAMAGGGLKRGMIYGDSDATSTDPARDAVPLADLHATIYRQIGINSDKELMTAGKRPIEIIDGGKPIDAIVA